MALNHARLPVPPLALVTPSTSETPFSRVAQGLSRLLRSQATPQLEATATGGSSVENRSGSGLDQRSSFMDTTVGARRNGRRTGQQRRRAHPPGDPVGLSHVGELAAA